MRIVELRSALPNNSRDSETFLLDGVATAPLYDRAARVWTATRPVGCLALRDGEAVDKCHMLVGSISREQIVVIYAWK